MKTIKIILVTLLICTGANAQRQLSPKMISEMNDKKWAFIVQKVQPTEQEAKQIRPIFDAHENEMLKFYMQEREERKKIAMGELKDADYAKLNEYGISMERKKIEKLEETHNKLKNILSPKKLFMYNQANREFHRQLFEQQKRHGKKQP